MNTRVRNTAFNKQVRLQGKGQLDLPGATIPDRIPGDGRIPKEILDKNLPLPYTIPQPPEEYEGDTLDVNLYINGSTTPVQLLFDHELGPVAGRLWPLPLEIPLTRLVELRTPETPTEYVLEYIIQAGGTNPTPADTTQYRIDRTYPYKVKEPASDLSPPAIAFPADLPHDREIDDVYLGSHPGGIDVRITLARLNAEATDVCDIYFGITTDPDYATPVLKDVVVPPTGFINIPLSILSALKDGVNTLTFTVKDRAGNISRRSRADTRVVRHLAPPVAEKPVVPLADGKDGDTLINVADCVTGVTVDVPVPQPSAPSDSIRVYWGSTQAGSEQPVGANTMLVFPVDYAIIKAEYGVTDGPVPTNVRYEMFRGAGAPIAKEDTDIDVDIFQDGPPNRDEPSDVNPDFELPRLVSSQGVDNILDDNDHGEDADIFVKLYAAPPAESALSVTVFYDDVPLTPDILLQPGDEGKELGPVVVPWSLIELKQNATIKTKWRLSRIGGNNPVFSREEDVVVNITKIDLPAPVVNGLFRNRISCATLNFPPTGDGTARRNLKVTVPQSPSMVVGRTVTLTWEGFSDANATVPIPGTRVQVIDRPVPDPVVDMEFEIGVYATHLKPVSGGWGKLTYTISSVIPESTPAIHGVFLLNNEGQFCEEVNP
ncbi:hypothetical protein LOY52_13815 [Pseudomonas sp. B21-051]|uniref:hypothetical protein n=1 Tax=Pseudomonas sp. B21-051 TaxID=2895491 RepID=UPI00215FF6BD|nr:hypothetical protein [Pseudomonas sp. B21-051]UVK85977.1 hypothetical protein LOY52_13815 [Pseudomonas sp. B21-051]